MASRVKAVRNGAIILGCGAILAAAAAPGAVAQTAGPSAAITRAALIQANADNTDVERATLVTQIQVDGQGDLSFDVPVVEGAAPKNMDAFGGPTVENGMAVYNITADGPDTFRTSQDFNVDEVPVKLTVRATLNGQPIEVTDLQNVTGEVELQYTAENLTSTPTTLEYEDGNKDIIKEDVDLVTSMGGTLDITFPPTWSNFESEDVEVISGDGSGYTLVSGGYTLMEPFGEPEGTITIKADVTNGSMPPAVLQFIVLEPKDNPTARAISESLAGGQASGQDIYAGGKTLDEGADLLIEGLTTAVDGANQIADGVATQVAPGTQALQDGAEELWQSFSAGAQDSAANTATDLVSQVRGETAYQELLGGFDTVNSAEGLFKVQGILGEVIGQLGSPFDTTIDANGVFFSPGDQTANSMISSVLFGVPGQKRPNPIGDALAQSPDIPPALKPIVAALFADKAQRGMTMQNPEACDLNSVPKDIDNPCGLVQLIDGALASPLLTPGPFGLNANQRTQKKYLDAIRDALVPQSITLPPGTEAILGDLSGKTVFTAVDGLPGGCLAEAAAGIAFEDPYGCNYSPQNAAAGLVLGKTDLSTLVTALGISLGKGPVTTSGPFNPTLQVDPSFNFELLGVAATYTDTLKFGVCPGPAADEDAVATHCSAAQVLSFLAAGISGNPVPSFTQTTNPGPIVSEPNDTLTAGTVWSDPVYGSVSPACVTVPDTFPPTPPAAPDTATQVEPFGLACAVRTLKDSLNNILLPTIGLGVQETTVASLGDGIYSPGCDSAATPTLTCGLSLIRAGSQELNAGIQDTLKPGTAELAAGLPAAVDGVQQIKTDGAGELLKSGNEAALDYGRQVALYEAMNNPDLVSKYIPGGAPIGENIVYNGVYKYELAGVGTQGTSTGTNLALGALGLLAAGGVGAWVAGRRAV